MKLNPKIRAVWEKVYKFRNKHIVLLCLLFLGGLIFALWKVPQWQLTGYKELTGETRVQLENDLRKTLAQILGGLFVLVGGYLAWRRVTAAEQTILVTQEGQITERFTRAIQQLGDKDSLAIRLGGIYALERIARDSRKDHWPIMEILTAYVREKAPWIESSGTVEQPDEIEPAADIQAIMIVIGRRTRSYEEGQDQRLDLQGTDLRGALLLETHLEKANLAEAHLEGAHLWNAHLEGASLDGACLDGAFLLEAHLEKAVLMGTDLKNVTGLTREQLKGAIIEPSTELPDHVKDD